MALEFRRIGYITALFGDSDVAISPDPAALTAQGIALFQWEGKLATEQRITCDLPFADLQKFFDKACDLHGENRVLEACKTKSKELFPARTTVVGRSLQSWTKAGATEDEIRKLVGLAAKSTLNSWFKDLNAGNELGKIVVAALPSIPTTSLAKTVKALERWVYSQ
jgi:hypothetical protein